MRKILIILLFLPVFVFSQRLVNLQKRVNFATNNQNAVARVYLDTVPSTPLTVYYSITGNGASKLADNTGSLVFDGSFSEDITFVKNATVTDDEDFTVSITTDVNYTVKRGVKTFQVMEDEPLAAFPSAYGAGAYVTGGRGGAILHVNTLSSTETGTYDGNTGIGYGSFLWAVKQTFPRTIVFDVSGTIRVDEQLFLNKAQGNVTILGQTAPQGGINIEMGRFVFSSSENVIVRYIRFTSRHFFIFGASGSVFSASGTNGLILDHCSVRNSYVSAASGFQGNNDQIDGVDDITIQRCLYGDSYTGMLAGANALTENRIELAGKTSVHHNAFVHIDHRFPNVSGNALCDNINNLVYNYGQRQSQFFNNSESNVIGNWIKKGSNRPDVNYGARFKIGDYLVDNDVTYLVPKIFIENNHIEDNNPAMSLVAGDDNWQNISLWNDPVGTTAPLLYRQSNQFTMLGRNFPIQTALEAKDDILSDVGANKTFNNDGSVNFYLDELDDILVNDVNNLECTICDEDGTYHARGVEDDYIYPIIPENTRPSNYYVSNPHIPETYLNSRQSDLAALGYAKTDSGLENFVMQSGYPLLEDFTNSVNGISLPPDTTAPTAPTNTTATNITNTTATVTWNTSTDDVGVSGYYIKNGVATISTVTGGESFNFTSLSPDTTYFFFVSAFDAAGNESADVQFSFTTTNNTTTPPTPSSGNKGERSKNLIFLGQ